MSSTLEYGHPSSDLVSEILLDVGMELDAVLSRTPAGQAVRPVSVNVEVSTTIAQILRPVVDTAKARVLTASSDHLEFREATTRVRITDVRFAVSESTLTDFVVRLLAAPTSRSS
jgi:hypothetical protein